MAFIELLSEDADDEDVEELFSVDRSKRGHVANFTRAFARRPAVFSAWRQLNRALKRSMEPRRYELATLAASRRLRSSYCSLAHGTVLADEILDPELVRSIALDPGASGLSAADLEVMAFADKVAADACSITAEDVQRLRDTGLSDDEIFDVAAAAAARCFFAKTLDALGVQPDAAYRDVEPGLRDALTVGRPIETA